jgi:integrase
LYVLLKRQRKAFNTIRNDLVAIKAFYEFHELHHRNLDEMLIHSQFEPILGSVDQFLAWLASPARTRQVVGRIGCTSDASDTICGETRDLYLRSLKLFLRWCSQRYWDLANAQASPFQVFASRTDSVTARFDSYLIGPTARVPISRGLSDVEISALHSVCDPNSPTNPFREQNRVRNFLMLEVLIETGIRLGELMILTTIDVVRGSDRAYLTITRPKNAGDDPRAKQPSIKTAQSERTVAISDALYLSLQRYIRNHRKPTRSAKPMKLSHRYLWVSERGRPLAINSAADIVNRLSNTARSINPLLAMQVTPHSFRYTFTERFLAYLIEVKHLDMERAKDELRTICGWSESSDMPQYYARRYIHNEANRHNAARVEAAWNRSRPSSPASSAT